MSSTQLLWAARFVLTIVLVLNVAPVQALTPGEVRDAAKDAVVYLRVTGAGQNGVPYEVDATGFLVSTTGELITAHHIIKDKDGRPLTNLKIEGWPGSRYDGRRREIEVLDEAPNLDLMLLRFKGNITDYKTVCIDPGVSLNDGDPLVAVGFPRGSELSVINGILSNRSGDRGWYTTNVDFMQGYSGGPVFDQKTGSVVGIVMGGTPEVAGRNFFLPISRANSLLNLLPSRPRSDCLEENIIVVQNGNINFGQSGFSFALNKVVAWNSPDGDILVADAKFFMPYDAPPYNGEQDKGAQSGIRQIPSFQYSSQQPCPTTGYTYHWHEAEVNGTYCVRTRNGNSYVKIKVYDVSKDSIKLERRQVQ